MSSYGNDGASDRLAAMRAPTEPSRERPPRDRQRSSVRRPELAVASAAVVVGIVILLVMAMPRGGGVQVATETSTTLAPTNNARIPNGMALVAFPVESGHLPASLRPGDRVKIVATPMADGTGMVRVLGSVVTIENIDTASSVDGSAVVSVIANESIAASVAASGPVHVFLVGERP